MLTHSLTHIKWKQTFNTITMLQKMQNVFCYFPVTFKVFSIHRFSEYFTSHNLLLCFLSFFCNVVYASYYSAHPLIWWQFHVLYTKITWLSFTSMIFWKLLSSTFSQIELRLSFRTEMSKQRSNWIWSYPKGKEGSLAITWVMLPTVQPCE